MSGWKEMTFAADEAQRAIVALVEECNRQKCAEMTAKEQWRRECENERIAHAATQDLLVEARKENDLMRQLLQVAVLSLPNDEDTELLRKRICALGGRRA